MWTALARDEDEHDRALARVESWLDPSRGWHTRLDGWDEALDEIEERLAEAERPEIGSDLDSQLLAALALERTEIDTLYHRLRAFVRASEPLAEPNGHAERLVDAAEHRSKNQGVLLEAALLRAHSVLREAS